MIKIQKISKDGLSKEEWGFTPQGTYLTYTSYFIYNRNNKREKWADEKPEPLNYSEWCKKNNFEQDDEYPCSDSYNLYLRKNNPILQKTRSGKPKLRGICAQIKDMPKCPPNIAIKAALEFCIQLKVIYE